jgi:phospholipid/cholesterol/gamma-HCH transport system permease protein
MIDRIQRLGAAFLGLLTQVGLLGLFLGRAVKSALLPPYRLYPVVKQIHFIGARSLFVIVFSGVFTGMILALQAYDTLERFGSVDIMGSAVGLGLIRELGPVLTALLVVGRAGSAICSELGMKRTGEQIDALECMAIDPYGYIVAPKVIAALIAVPLLTAIFDAVGIFGGWLVGVVIFGVNEGAYFQSMYDAVKMSDIHLGVAKSLVFGLLIIWISGAKGFFIHRQRFGAMGAEGVGHATTDAVVLASVSILVADYLIAAVMI